MLKDDKAVQGDVVTTTVQHGVRILVPLAHASVAAVCNYLLNLDAASPTGDFFRRFSSNYPQLIHDFIIAYIQRYCILCYVIVLMFIV